MREGGTAVAGRRGRPTASRAASIDAQILSAAQHLLPPDLAGRLRAYELTIRSARHWHESRQMQRLVRSIAGDFPELAAE